MNTKQRWAVVTTAAYWYGRGTAPRGLLLPGPEHPLRYALVDVACDGGAVRNRGRHVRSVALSCNWDGASVGSGDGELNTPCGLCFIDDDRHVAIADNGNQRVSVFSVNGQFIRHVGVGVLEEPSNIACSTVDELVVADSDNSRIAVFSASGDLIATLPLDRVCVGVAVHGSTVFARLRAKRCVVLTWSTR
jgi:hypothetical protein